MLNCGLSLEVFYLLILWQVNAERPRQRNPWIQASSNRWIWSPQPAPWVNTSLIVTTSHLSLDNHKLPISSFLVNNTPRPSHLKTSRPMSTKVSRSWVLPSLMMRSPPLSPVSLHTHLSTYLLRFFPATNYRQERAACTIRTCAELLRIEYSLRFYSEKKDDITHFIAFGQKSSEYLLMNQDQKYSRHWSHLSFIHAVSLHQGIYLFHEWRGKQEMLTNAGCQWWSGEKVIFKTLFVWIRWSREVRNARIIVAAKMSTQAKRLRHRDDVLAIIIGVLIRFLRCSRALNTFMSHSFDAVVLDLEMKPDGASFILTQPWWVAPTFSD